VRVALLPSAYAPAVGGVEELTHRLANQLRASGDAVEVWTIRHPRTLPADEVIDGVRVRRFVLPLPSARPGALARFPLACIDARRALAAAEAEFRPDVLHVQCFSANGAYATSLAARRRVPLVVTLQGETVMDDHDIYDRSVLLRHALRRALRRADAVTGCSQFVLDDAGERFGLSPRKGTVVPNGVELGGDHPPRSLRLPFERFVLGLGRAVPNKGFDLLLAAFARLAPRHPGLGLLIGGGGRACAALADQAAALGIADRVSLPGSLDRGGVAWAMANAEVFVLPSRVEPFGIVVLEALRACCPTVVSCHGGASEIVRHEREGLVADPFDASALSRAIERLLQDRQLALTLAEAGRERAAEFSWVRIASRYRQIYDAGFSKM
jgi:glycosyltransferase involved in cell wall biosynthesis